MKENHLRKCWDCGNVATHESIIKPGVLCKKCGSQDTRKVRVQPSPVPARSSTETLIAACRELAATVQCDDGVANEALREIAERLEEFKEDAEKWRALMKSCSRPDKMRSDVAPVWDSRNVGQ
jgi:DNA-directed RNA polymerase subunit RPC12/RpoP